MAWQGINQRTTARSVKGAGIKWQNQKNQRQKQNINPQTPASEDEVTNQLQAQSSSDELDSIDADAKATNFNSIGGEVDSAERAAAEDQ